MYTPAWQQAEDEKAPAHGEILRSLTLPPGLQYGMDSRFRRNDGGGYSSDKEEGWKDKKVIMYDNKKGR